MILVIIHNQIFKVEKELAIGTETFYVAREVPNLTDRVESKETHLIRKSSLKTQECYVPLTKMSESDCFLISNLVHHVGFVSAQPIAEGEENEHEHTQ